jgi:PAS domain S-box-containing protein
MKLSTRLTIVMVSLVLMTATALGLLTYRKVAELSLPRALDRVDTHARLLAVELEASLRSARGDAAGFRAAVAVNNIMAATLDSRTDPSASAIETEWRRRLALRFVAELTAKPDYAQFRVIGVDDGGRELVRVDRSGPDGAIRVVPDDELQRKGDRNYFKEAIALSARDVYVSPIDLNQEHDAIDTPRVPTLRTAAPVYFPDGKPFGIVIINVDLRRAFARVSSSTGGVQHYIVNEAGDYLVHPDPNSEFGFEFGKRHRIQEDFPEFAKISDDKDTAPRVMDDHTGARFGVGWEAVQLAGGPRVAVIETVPYAQLMVAANVVREFSLVGGLTAVLCAFGLAVVLARSLTKPLVQMTKAVNGFSRNEVSDVPAGGGREISLLATAFTKMAAESQEKTAALEREIEERRRIFDTSPDLILVADSKGNFVRVSPSSEAMLGYTAEEMVDHSASDFIFPDDLEPTRAEMRSARRGHVMRNFQTRYVSKDGCVIALDWSGVWSEPTRQYFFVGRDMTEQKSAEEKVREQKALLDTALNNMHHALLMFDKDNRAVVINKTYTDMYRLSPETVKPGCTMRELLTQRIASSTWVGDIDEYIENRIVDKVFNIPDGRSIRVVNRMMANGGWVSTHEDVTQQRKADATIKEYAEREQLFIAAVESANDAIVTKTLDGVITGWNQAAEALFGYTADETIGKPIDIIVPSELRDDVSDILGKIKNGSKVDHQETVRIHKNGRRIDVSLSVSSIRSQTGAIIGAAKVARDITAKRKAELALRESEQMAQEIITGSLDGFTQVNEAGELTEWNPRAEEIFGWSRQEALGRPITDLFLPAEYSPRFREMKERLLAGEGGTNVGVRSEYEAVRKDGRRIKVEVAITALRWKSGLVFNGFIRDLTEKIAAEEQLRQAQKMESVGQLTGGIAHDFNNMLTVITGTIDILGNAVADKPHLAAITKLISEAADRGAELTGHLLAFARKQPLQPRDTDINTLIFESANLLRPALGENIEISLQLDKSAWPALVDPSQLTTALLNLAVNARDAMPEGGKLTLETSNVILDQSYADGNAEVQPGNYVLVAISDTGDGIPEGIRAKVFEPFFTTKGVGKGTGLGLSMVFGFVKQTGGHIKVYSEEGHGTTFKLYLPRAAALPQQIAETLRDIQIEGGSETILVVEDDLLVRTSVITQLQSLGYKTLSAINGSEALAIADRGEAFDLLFTDVIMPGQMNGRLLAEEMSKRRSPLKVLFTSGYTENAIIHHGRLDVGVLLLAKPYRKQDLARMIRNALEAAETLPARNASGSISQAS